NTGHDGSLSTLHANNPREGLGRLEVLVAMSGVDVPAKAVRGQIASAIHLIVHASRLQDGSRKIVQITEVTGMEGEVITLQDIFLYKQTGVTTDGSGKPKVVGYHTATGIRPQAMGRIEESGLHLSPEIFNPHAQHGRE
ncbi:MAG: ATPase, T2SS/T4P/T4SS family, partial [Nitrospinota bacterium]